MTLAAARTYCDHVGCEAEAGRRELTILLLSAHRTGTMRSGAETWRARSLVSGLDLQASVAREGLLAVVTHVHIRDA